MHNSFLDEKLSAYQAMFCCVALYSKYRYGNFYHLYLIYSETPQNQGQKYKTGDITVDQVSFLQNF